MIINMTGPTLIALFILVASFLVAGGVVLIINGKRFSIKALTIIGWIMVILVSITGTIALVPIPLFVEIALRFVTYFIVACFALPLVAGIISLVKGCSKHIKSLIIIGSVYIGVIATAALVPLTLLIMFGSSISMM